MITPQEITATIMKMMTTGIHTDTGVVSGDDGGPVESEHVHNDRIHNTAVTYMNWLLIITNDPQFNHKMNITNS